MNIKIIKNSESGFTLFEVLAIVVIIGIMAGIGYADFDAMRNQLALKRASYQLAQDLRKAQEMALSSSSVSGKSCVLASDCGEGGICKDGKCLAYGYGVYIDLTEQPTKKYMLYSDTADATISSPESGFGYYNSALPGDHIYNEVNLERGIIIYGFKGYDAINIETEKLSIEFVPPNPDVEIFDVTGVANPVNAGVQIVLALESDPTKIKCVGINKAGLVTINDSCEGL